MPSHTAPSANSGAAAATLSMQQALAESTGRSIIIGSLIVLLGVGALGIVVARRRREDAQH